MIGGTGVGTTGGMIGGTGVGVGTTGGMIGGIGVGIGGTTGGMIGGTTGGIIGGTGVGVGTTGGIIGGTGVGFGGSVLNTQLTSFFILSMVTSLSLMMLYITSQKFDGQDGFSTSVVCRYDCGLAHGVNQQPSLITLPTLRLR
jgi:hypothetical protein